MARPSPFSASVAPEEPRASEAKPSRRAVLAGGGAGGAVIAAGLITGPFFPGRVLGANDRVALAVIGIRGQGTAHIDGFAKQPNTRIKTLCDVDENLFASRLESFRKKHDYEPGTSADLRRVFDDKEVDAVSLAVPNHWHALATIWACQAKKHVYVEKPSCHNVWEGRQMVHAARRYGVAVQVGFQNRSRANTRAAIELIRAGKLGKVYMAKGLCFKPRGDIGRYPDGPMPDGAKFSFVLGGPTSPTYTAAYLDKVHYDTWLGPAPLRPFNPNRFHYNWHWHWDYGNGDTGNQGPHQFDVGRWGLGREDHPVRVSSHGGMLAYQNAQETPNTQISVFEYVDGTIFQFETRGLLTNGEGESRVRMGNIFLGTEGRLELDADGNWKTYFGAKDEPGPTSASIVGAGGNAADARKTVGSGLDDHFANFVAAVRAGSGADLNCEVEVGYRSSVLPHIANISYRLRRELRFDGGKERFVGDAEADRMLRHNDRKGYQVPTLG